MSFNRYDIAHLSVQEKIDFWGVRWSKLIEYLYVKILEYLKPKTKLFPRFIKDLVVNKHKYNI